MTSHTAIQLFSSLLFSLLSSLSLSLSLCLCLCLSLSLFLFSFHCCSFVPCRLFVLVTFSRSRSLSRALSLNLSLLHTHMPIPYPCSGPGELVGAIHLLDPLGEILCRYHSLCAPLMRTALSRAALGRRAKLSSREPFFQYPSRKYCRTMVAAPDNTKSV